MKTYDNKQITAIEASDGYFLVLAPPGCGKTDILSERIVRARNKGVPFEEMLCLTFTNRASRGMKNRIMEKIGEDASNIFVGNVHRYCSNFLYANALVGENTSIIDEDDLTDILLDFDADFFLNTRQSQVDKGKVKSLNDLDSYIQQRRYGQPLSSFFVPSEFDAYYTIAEAANFDPLRVTPYSDTEKMVLYALQYRLYKENKGMIDFSDILIEAYEHLRNDVARKYKRFKWVQIDEVQDLNALQMAIIDELTDSSDNFTVMYLGDEQQAIFSFLGAKLGQLDALKKRCKGNILHLEKNYRSPKYLLEIFNTYAECELNVDPALLPEPTYDIPKDKLDLILAESDSTDMENERITKMVNYYMKFDEERLAILVATNKAADDISKKLSDEGFSNFKISGTDMFKSKSYKTLSSFFCVLANEYNSMAWVRLLHGIGAIKTQSLARSFVSNVKDLMMTPFDLFEDKSYVARFNEVYSTQEMVFFDTETTGLNVLEDDIVQIAAFKVSKGQKIPNSDFNIFIHTDREIPEKLGDKPNPLVEEYARNKHYSKEEGLSLFLDYIGNDPILGHNVNYDYRILQNNVERYLQEQVTFDIYDSLKLIKCIEPKLRMYKLEFLIDELNLKGKNSHLANEDVEATKSLVDYCYNRSRTIVSDQSAFMSNLKVKNIINKVRQLEPLFAKEQDIFYQPIQTTQRTIVDELKSVYDDMLSMSLIESLGDKFDIFLSFVQSEWIDPFKNESINEQVYNHINDMTSSISEGDLVNSAELVTDRIFVMTVYKGKGLEFDNVVVLGAVDGTYPYYLVNKVLNNYGSTPEEIAKAKREKMEDARKFYVAISRAKKRLCISYYNRNDWGYYQKLTPFMNSIKHFFYSGRNKTN
jgi:DNA helicase-2/ATP-dependent DNA helicase PcrA